MSVRSAARTWSRTVLRVTGAVLRMLLWYVPASLALVYASAPVTVAVSFGTMVCLVLWYGRRGAPRSTAERFAILRLRRLGPATRWVAGLAIAVPLALLALGILLIRWGYPLDQTPDLLGPYLARPGGWWAVGALAVLVAPVLEEFTFRGWIQRPLERQLGAPSAIAISAALFALMHGEPLRLPLLFLVGVILGAIVYLTRSIWAGVAVHAGNNALAMLSSVPPVEAGLSALGMPSIWELVGAVCLTTLLFAFLARGLWRATRHSGVPSSCTVPPVPLASGNGLP